MRVRAHPRPAAHGERGYILLTLILAVALLAIAAVVIAPTIAFQMKRDREEELIHRGVQYSRAIKHYVKKFGRYPTRIEDLENTNEVRFLRRRYKDPITGKDFKLLYMGDVQLMYAGGVGAGVAGNALAPGAPQGPGGAGMQANSAAGLANVAALAGGFGAAGPAAGPGGLNQNPGATAGTTVTTVGGSGPGGEESEETEGEGANPASPGAAPGQNPSAPGSGPLGQPAAGTNGPQVFGGGPIVGVVSTSKEKTIRVFNKKDHYNQWQFIYDPSTDRGGLLATPSTGTPALMSNATSTATQAGASGAAGTPPGQQPSPGAPSGPPSMEPPPSPPEQEGP
jgi:hypothetical protein